jgi:hypothetical protein
VLHRRLVALIAAALLSTTFAAAPADARTKSKKQYRNETPSLDGRTTGQLRTCGYDTLQYGSGGPRTAPTATEPRAIRNQERPRRAERYRLARGGCPYPPDNPPGALLADEWQ